MSASINAWGLRIAVAIGVAACALAPPAHAATRAWLDRDSVAAGESVVLSIESDQGLPDTAPLQRDFDVRVAGRDARMDASGGGVRMHVTLRLRLTPRRSGVLLVPPLRVGAESTPALNVAVASGAATPAAATSTAAAPAGAAFAPRGELSIEAVPDDPTPYAQQAVGWTVRLYSALPIMSGRLDQPVPDGATLQRVGDDVQVQREIGGRRYTVVERRYLLIPDRSGALRVPGATFEGRAVANFFEDLFGRQGDALSTRAPARTLRVRPIPAGAPQPWLPLHGLNLRYVATPQALTANAAGTVTIELSADGASAAQLPTLELPASDGLQAFAEPPAVREDSARGRPRTVLTRSFALVPTRSGEVELPGLRIGWWDVAADRARTTALPPLRWQVAPAAGLPTAPPAPSAVPDATSATTSTADARVPRGWLIATVGFALAWLLTLVWALSRGVPSRAQASAPPGGQPPARAGGHAVRKALDTGDLGDVLDALRAQATPPADSVDALLAHLADDAQRAAVQLAQRARFGDGDGVAARTALRQAFARGPRWHAAREADAPLLPPLYP